MRVENLTSALGVHVLRRHSNLESARIPPPAVRGVLDPRRLRRVKDFIECNLGRNLTIETMAKEACRSPFHSVFVADRVDVQEPAVSAVTVNIVPAR